jgi:hypothetical protein
VYKIEQLLNVVVVSRLVVFAVANAALKSYSNTLAIFERLANSDPSNAGWQRDLSVTYAKLAGAYCKSNETAEGRDNGDQTQRLTAIRQGTDGLFHRRGLH